MLNFDPFLKIKDVIYISMIIFHFVKRYNKFQKNFYINDFNENVIFSIMRQDSGARI